MVVGEKINFSQIVFSLSDCMDSIFELVPGAFLVRFLFGDL
jgi:hypothetical protein